MPLRRILLPAVCSGLAATLCLAAAPAAAPTPTVAPSPEASAAHRPKRVVIIVVDALSREVVRDYRMKNVERLMREGVNAPNAYVGHTGSVTVVTHNVITSGLLPKNMGWSSEGYRDVTGVLAAESGGKDMWMSSDWTKEQMFAVQRSTGSPKLADYLHRARPGSKVVTISPKGYAAWAFGGAGSDSIVTFSSADHDCDGDGVNNWRRPSGVAVPTYLAEPVCGRFYVDSSKDMRYDTDRSPARMYPLDGNRYTIGKDPDHFGGDVWATDAALAVMRNEPDWSGIFVTLPGVDKSAHMWGGLNDPGGPEPMTHLPEAARVADDQVGRLVDQLKADGHWDDTAVVLTADHGQVPGKHFHGLDDGSPDRGYDNWYYGDLANGSYLSPQPALKPLTDTGNVAMNYSDSMLSTWLKDRSPSKATQAVRILEGMPGVSAVWVRNGERYVRQGPPRLDRMSRGERTWFQRHAQELLDTAAGPAGPDIISTLVDDTTYSVAGDHGGIQRRAQQIPIVFAGGGFSAKDTAAPLRSVDIMPTLLRRMGVAPSAPLDGIAYDLPLHQPRK